MYSDTAITGYPSYAAPEPRAAAARPAHPADMPCAPAGAAVPGGDGLAVYYQFAGYQAWLEGRDEDALSACRRAYQVAAGMRSDFSTVYCGLGLAALYVDCKAYAQALPLLSENRRQAMGLQSDCMKFTAAMIGAQLAMQRGKRRFCLDYLRQALALGAAHDYYAVPWLRRERVHELLNLARAHDIEPCYAQALAGACGLSLDVAAPAPCSRPACFIQTLGGLHIRSSAAQAIAYRKTPKKPLTLLLHLVAGGRDGVTVEYLIETLWSNTEHEVGYSRLKTTVSRLRTLLGDDRIVVVSRNRVFLDRERCEIDAWQVEDIAHDCNNLSESHWEQALQLYRGQFFTGFFDDRDLQTYQMQIHGQFLRLVARAGQHFRQNGADERALAVFSGALRLDPLNELLCEEVLGSLAALGRGKEMQILFEDFVQRCATELDSDVSAHLRTRYDELSLGAPA